MGKPCYLVLGKDLYLLFNTCIQILRWNVHSCWSLLYDY